MKMALEFENKLIVKAPASNDFASQTIELDSIE